MKNKIRHIIITGPECSGKSSLANLLAEAYKKPVQSEYAREYLNKYGTSYQFLDLLAIAKKQKELLDTALSKNALVISDTGFLVLKIWSQIRFNMVHPYIDSTFYEGTNEFYLLNKPDFGWEYDPLRENEFEREELFEIYQHELEAAGKEYYILEGKIQTRLTAIARSGIFDN